MIRFVIGFVACLILTISIPGLADDDDPIRKKLDKARAAYEVSGEKYSNNVATYFDEQEKAARNKENKSMVDRNEAERKAFEQRGDLPQDAPDKLINDFWFFWEFSGW